VAVEKVPSMGNRTTAVGFRKRDIPCHRNQPDEILPLELGSHGKRGR
jgi:hypothetical protein